MKKKIQLSPKVKTKNTLVYAATGLVGALLIGVGAFSFLNFGSSGNIKAETAAEPPIIRSQKSGNWNDNVWTPRKPKNGDRVLIEEGAIVTISSNGSFNGEIVVNGELRVQNARLSMNNDSRVAVNEGGRITFSQPVWRWNIIVPYLSPTGSINIGGNWGRLGFQTWTGGTTMQDDPINGPAYFGDGAELLPIDLISFDAVLTTTGDVTLTWATAAEMNNDFFSIEKSIDGQSFFVLDTMAGAGNSNTLREYTYMDAAPVAGYNYYRLKQTDFDGKFEYFKVVAVMNDNVKPELSNISVGPNPFRDEFEINFYSVDNSVVHLKLMDMQGNAVFSKSLEAQKGPNTLTYSDPGNLKHGIYLLSIMHQGTPATTIRVVKQ